MTGLIQGRNGHFLFIPQSHKCLASYTIAYAYILEKAQVAEKDLLNYTVRTSVFSGPTYAE